MKNFSRTALRSIQSMKRTALFILMSQALNLFVQASQINRDDAGSDVVPSFSTPTVYPAKMQDVRPFRPQSCEMLTEAYEFIQEQFGDTAAPIFALLENGLDTDFLTYCSLVESLISPQNKEFIRSKGIIKQFCRISDPFVQFLIAAQAHQFFMHNTNKMNMFDVFFIAGPLMKCSNREVVQAIITHIKNLFMSEMDGYDRALIVTALVNHTPSQIADFSKAILMYEDLLFTGDMDGYDQALITQYISKHSPYIISILAKRFTPTMNFHERLEIIRAAAV